MIRKLKTLGVAVIAVLALSAAVASTASAANFTASSYPTAASATSSAGNDDFKTEAGSVECHASFAVAALNGPSETVKVTPTYTGCKAFGFLNATVDMNGCYYILNVNGQVDIHCTKGPIVIVAGTCTIHILQQTSRKSISISNGPGYIIIKASVSSITYNVTIDGFGCPFAGTGEKTGATYTQNSSLAVSSTNGASIDVG